MYLIVGEVDEYIKEESENRDLVFGSTDESKEVFTENTQNYGIKLNIWLRQ